jgi:hypothetical protein
MKLSMLRVTTFSGASSMDISVVLKLMEDELMAGLAFPRRIGCSVVCFVPSASHLYNTKRRTAYSSFPCETNSELQAQRGSQAERVFRNSYESF